jgi:DNA-binding NtrC family response regulator
MMQKRPISESKDVSFTLLTVSSNAEDADSLSRMLAPARVRVEEVASFREAKEALEKQRPTVIACDRDLPDGSWRDLLSLAGATEQDTPVVVMARHADEHLWAEVLNVGGYDVIAKPFERAEVSRVLSTAARRQLVGRTA